MCSSFWYTGQAAAREALEHKLRLAEEQVEVFSAALEHKLLLAQDLARTKQAAKEEAKLKAEEEATVAKKRADQETAEKLVGVGGNGLHMCLFL